MRIVTFLVLALMSIGLTSATTIIDNFEHGIGSWTSSSSVELDEWARGSQSLKVTNYDHTGWYVQLYDEDLTYEGSGKIGFWMYIASDAKFPAKFTVYYDDLSVDSGFATPVDWEPDTWVFFECIEARRPVLVMRIGMAGDATGVFYIDDVGFYNGMEPGVTGFAVTGVSVNLFPVFLLLCAATAFAALVWKKKK